MGRGRGGGGIGEWRGGGCWDDLQVDVRGIWVRAAAAVEVVDRAGGFEGGRTDRAARRIGGDSVRRSVITPCARPDDICDGSARPSEPIRSVRQRQQALRLTWRTLIGRLPDRRRDERHGKRVAAPFAEIVLEEWLWCAAAS